MLIGAVGDLHGDFAALDRVMTRHPEVAFWLCPGDLASETGEYPRPVAPLYWIKGNNENFDFVAEQPAGTGTLPNLHYIPNGIRVEANGLTLAGLGGTFAPTWYETPASDLPHPKKGRAKATELADKRRHFVREEVEACKALRNIDVLLTHEAAKPFRPFPNGRGPDAGKSQINEVLTATQPRLHVFGHHHRFSEQVQEAVPSIGLDLVSRGYLLIDTPSLGIHTVKY